LLNDQGCISMLSKDFSNHGFPFYCGRRGRNYKQHWKQKLENKYKTTQQELFKWATLMLRSTTVERSAQLRFFPSWKSTRETESTSQAREDKRWSSAGYHIGSKFTNHSPLACREGQKVSLVAVLSGFRSDLSITCKTDGNFGNVCAGVSFSKVAYQRKQW